MINKQRLATRPPGLFLANAELIVIYMCWLARSLAEEEVNVGSEEAKSQLCRHLRHLTVPYPPLTSLRYNYYVIDMLPGILSVSLSLMPPGGREWPAASR